MSYSLKPNGVFVCDNPVLHREDEYDPSGFDVLVDMQARHFWYRGRHRFLLAALRMHLGHVPPREGGLSAVDLGGGCGGWVSYLDKRLPGAFAELALCDSSLRALELAGPVVGAHVARYHADILRLGWHGRWDVAFLLDVLEHVPDDGEVLAQISDALRPGGLLFVTTPALRAFWSYNDDMASHLRRYAKADFVRLGRAAGLPLRRARYFMFFLSPFLWLSRLRRPELARMSKDEIRRFARRTHRVPAGPINALLDVAFSLETPLGLRLPFPWGTSILGVFQKPT